MQRQVQQGAVGIDRTGHRDADAEHRGRVHLADAERRGDRGGGQIDQPARIQIGRQVDGLAPHDRAVEIDHGDGQQLGVDVDADRMGSVRAQPHRSTGFAEAFGAFLLLLDEQALLQQDPQDPRHRLLGQPGPPGDLGPADDAGQPDRLDDHGLVEGAQVVLVRTGLRVCSSSTAESLSDVTIAHLLVANFPR